MPTKKATSKVQAKKAIAKKIVKKEIINKEALKEEVVKVEKKKTPKTEEKEIESGPIVELNKLVKGITKLTGEQSKSYQKVLRYLESKTNDNGKSPK